MRNLTRGMIRSSSLASTLLIAACSGSDNQSTPGGVDDIDGTLVSLSVPLTQSETVNSTTNVPAEAMGTADITVDTQTGAVTGSVTVSGLSGVIDAAHIHEGAVGQTGAPAIFFEQSADNPATVWTVEANSAFDAPQIQTFLSDGMYINIHTVENTGGEVRGQIALPK